MIFSPILQMEKIRFLGGTAELPDQDPFLVWSCSLLKANV